MAQAQQWVFLIGIDYYVDQTQRLRGCLNDIHDIEQAFSDAFGPIRLFKLTASEPDDESSKSPSGPPSTWPTYKNVVQTLEDITISANPGDFVYIHYSGHGTSTPTTAEYREQTDFDAALVLFDIDTETRYLRGIEIAALLDRMVASDLKITIVLDCCGSGAISRGNCASITGTRCIQWNDEIALAHPVASTLIHKPTKVGRGYRDASSKDHFLLKPENYSLLAACGPHEIAAECRATDGRIHGVLSYLLVDALGSSDRRQTTRNFNIARIYRDICSKLHVPLPSQHPVLFGIDRADLFSQSTRSHSSISMASVTKISLDRVGINLGRIHGVEIGDIYSTFPPSTQNIDENALQSEFPIRITALHALDAEAQLIQPQIETPSPIRIGWSVKLSIRRRPIVLVRFHNPEPLKLRAEIHNSHWLAMDDDYLGHATDHSVPVFQISFLNGRIAVLDCNANPILHLPELISDDNPIISSQTLFTLEHLAKYASVEKLHNWFDNKLPESYFEINISIKDESTLLSSMHKIQVEHDSVIKVTVTNLSDTPLHLTVLSLSPLRRIFKLFPGPDRGGWKVILPKQMKDGRQTKGATSFHVNLSVPSVLTDADVKYVEDVFKFFVSTRPTSFSSLELPELTHETLASTRRSSTDKFLAYIDLLYKRTSNYVGRGDDALVRGDLWTCQTIVARTIAAGEGRT